MTARPPDALIAGYRRFRRERFPAEAERFARLAHGQSPETLVIGCVDSRVDPATIFAAAPGELLVVRNVAALVPPCEEDGAYHGTSAAIEFAVTGLAVRNIVVLGHGMCGGVAASLAAAENKPVGRFIAPWVGLLGPAEEQVRRDASLTAPEARQAALERLAIRQSLANLVTFPFVRDAIEGGKMALHGAWFSIAEGELHWLDPESGAFVRTG